MEPIILTPTMRDELTAYLESLRKEFVTAKHVSGDDCAHCGLRAEIKSVETTLSDGFYISYMSLDW